MNGAHHCACSLQRRDDPEALPHALRACIRGFVQAPHPGAPLGSQGKQLQVSDGSGEGLGFHMLVEAWLSFVFCYLDSFSCRRFLILLCHRVGASLCFTHHFARAHVTHAGSLFNRATRRPGSVPRAVPEVRVAPDLRVYLLGRNLCQDQGAREHTHTARRHRVPHRHVHWHVCFGTTTSSRITASPRTPRSPRPPFSHVLHVARTPRAHGLRVYTVNIQHVANIALFKSLQ